MLECKQVVKKYYKKTAVNNVSITIEPGKIYALLGPNGSGKTTLMKMIAGLIKPNSGQIIYDGNEIGIETKKKIAYMSTEPFYYNYMTVKDVGKYYNDFFEDFDIARYEELIQRMNLKMTDKSKTLSSGMAAKLKIAATLARNAHIFMLDEPLNGIDLIAREHIMNTMLEAMNPSTSLLVSSHLVDELEKVVNHAVFLKEGDLVLSGTIEELRDKYDKTIVDLYKEIYAY